MTLLSPFAVFGLPLIGESHFRDVFLGSPPCRWFACRVYREADEPPLPDGVGCEQCRRPDRGVHTESWERGRLLCTVCGEAFIGGSWA